jgi:hypothetical protein
MNLINRARLTKFTFLLPFAAAAVACVLVLQVGCSFLSPLKHPKKDLVDCYAAALQPVAGEVFDVAQLARDLVLGKAVLGALLSNLRATEAEAQTLVEALHACVPAPAAIPSGSAG